MKKLLVLTTRYPYPVVGGDRLRIYQICKELANAYEITLLTLCESKSEMDMAPPDDDVFASIERVFMPRWQSWLNCALSLPSKVPLQVAYYRNRVFRERAAELMPKHDATLAHLIRAGDAVKHRPGIKFLEMTDAISMNYERVRKAGHAKSDFRSHIFSLESRRLRQYEESIVDSFDHSFLVSEIDRNFLFGLQPLRLDRVSVSSNGVDLKGMPFQFSPLGGDIVFIGNMYSLQNLDAANYMALELLPLIRERRPGTSLRLIGRIQEDHANRLAKIDGVEVSGEVDDIGLAVRGGGVGVCPLRLGAGVQNKVLEYMALGLPTVSTSLGLEGFGARDGIELLVGDSASDFVDAVLRLLNNRDEAQRMAVAARGYVEKNHSWDAQLAPMSRRINVACCGCNNQQEKSTR